MFPTKDEFERLLGKFERVPVYMEIDGDLDTPVSILQSLLDRQNVILLESANQNKVYSRFSFLAFDSKRFTLSKDGFKNFNVPNYNLKSSVFFEDYGNFCGGFIALLPFEFVQLCNILRYPLRKQSEFFGVFYLVEKFLVYDNYTNKLYLAKSAKMGDSYKQVEQELINMRLELEKKHIYSKNLQKTQILKTIQKEKFLDKVAYLREQIENGEAIQVVLSDFIEVYGIEPFEFYRNLRKLNPSPYMFFIKDRDSYIVGSSPEVHLSVRQNRALLKPIAGTRPITDDESKNKLNEADLLSDEKENAEHLMLVDLARNDLYRVCKVNSVKVTQFKRIERYSHVMHLVSKVEGELKDNVMLFDALLNTFPAGTVSGAPKVRSIELIDEIEETPRNFYAGCVGYIGFNGNMDMAITIRTAFFDGQKAKFQAGAGIVYDSVPINEYREVIAKLGALLKAGGIDDSIDR